MFLSSAEKGDSLNFQRSNLVNVVQPIATLFFLLQPVIVVSLCLQTSRWVNADGTARTRQASKAWCSSKTRQVQCSGYRAISTKQMQGNKNASTRTPSEVSIKSKPQRPPDVLHPKRAKLQGQILTTRMATAPSDPAPISRAPPLPPCPTLLRV